MHVAHLSPHISNDLESLYHLVLTPTVTVAVSGVPGDRSRVHTHDHDVSEAPDELPGLILSSKPKPLGKYRPPHPPSIISPRESFYPP
ncbi:hypothetical protein Tco_1032149 [Tanacetum coccineum]|uniref:Uncharacterized protein n=1 Tax=Tanacetum coccineum TaxID=301880 RepID=A0ABQ5GCQ0_9ASTR